MKKQTPRSPLNPQQVIVETPRNCRNKYKYDEQSGRMKLSKVMPEGMMFPYDFGFIPETEAEDGDPIDVLVLSDEPMFPGCQVDCRLIGVIKANQKEQGLQKRNDRIVAVAEASIRYADVHDLSHLPESLLKQIQEFFINYQKVRDIEYEILGTDGAQEAVKLVNDAARQRKAA